MPKEFGLFKAIFYYLSFKRDAGRLEYFICQFFSTTVLMLAAYEIYDKLYRELYGGGMDVLVSLRAALAGIMFLLIVLFFQFIKIKDLKSQRTILRGIFVGWSSLFIILIIINPSLIYFIVLSGIAGIVNLIALFSLVDLIKEERNTLTDKEIYLLQQLANKK